jgi:peptidyl-prolyl cis-trans isomerase A (cyclophilin A)
MIRRYISLILALFCSAAAQKTKEPPKMKPGLYAIFNTSEGTFEAQLFEKDVPKTVKNFVELAQGTKPWLDPKTKTLVRRPLYDNIIFHRVIPGTMIQSGDPTGLGTHNCGVNITDETLPGIQFSGPGRLAMANTGQENSGGCQFFVTVQPMTEWTGKYTIFGQIVGGMNVVEKIDHLPVKGEKPVHPATLNSVSIVRLQQSAPLDVTTKP